MTRIVVRQLIFDEHNLEHIKKHNVTQEDAKETGKNVIYHKHTHSKRYLVVGRCRTRLISLVLSRIGVGKYYLVTARDAGRNERRRVYEKENKK